MVRIIIEQENSCRFMIKPITDEDIKLLFMTLELASQGGFEVRPNPKVGCVIVNDDEILARGYHACAGKDHAEVAALKQITPTRAAGATLYVSLEPCCHQGKTPACCDSILANHIARVVVITDDPNPQVAGKGISRLRTAGVQVDVLTETSLNTRPIKVAELIEQAKQINRDFFKRMRTQMPWVHLKMAASLDGRTAMANGQSQWISNAASRQDVQQLRLAACAILTSAATLIADNPRLNLRPAQGSANLTDYQPGVVVLDTYLETQTSHQIFHCTEKPRPIYVISSSAQQSKTTEVAQLTKQGAQLLWFDTADGHLPLQEVLKALGKQGLNHLLVEAGPGLAGAIIEAGLADEISLYMAPKLLGHIAKPMFKLAGIQRLEDHIPLKLKHVDMLDQDLKLNYQL